MNILRCVSWTAVSSEEQARPGKGSLDDQRAGNLAFIQDIATRYPGNRGILLEQLSVEGSRRIVDLYDARKQYPAYQRLYELIQAEAFDVLVVPRWDRLGREESLLLTLRDLCLGHHIAVAVVGSPPPSLDPAELRRDESWRITGTIQAWSSGREDREIARRVKQGRRDRVLLEKKFLGAPFGYRYRYDEEGNQHIEVDKVQAATVRLALVDLYLERGYGAPNIAAELNRRGIPTAEGYQWFVGTVNALLRRRWVYAGYLEFGRHSEDMPFQRVEGAHEPILSTEEVQRIEAEIRNRNVGRRQQRPLSGVVWCGYCDRPMAANSRKGYKGIGYYHYLRCGYCRAAIRAEVAMEALVEFVAYIQTVEDASDLVDSDDYQAELADLRRRIVTAESQVADAEAAINRLLDAYESGVLAKEYLTDRITARQTQQATYQAELAELNTRLAAALAAGPPQAQLDAFKAQAAAMLDNIEIDPVGTRRWFARYVRITTRGPDIQHIRLLI